MDVNVYRKKSNRRGKTDPNTRPCAVVFLSAEEMAKLTDLSNRSGMPESDYIQCILEHALECGCTFVS